MCGVTGGIAWHPRVTWLPSTAASESPPPPYGTGTRSMPVVCVNKRADKSGVVPMPGVAMLNLPGCDFACAMRSAIDLTGDDACRKNACGEAARLETGMRSRYGSYGIFEY